MSLKRHTVSEKTRKKISLTRKKKALDSTLGTSKGKKRGKVLKLAIPKEKFTCYVCNAIVGGKTNLIRWHNEKCKHKELI